MNSSIENAIKTLGEAMRAEVRAANARAAQAEKRLNAISEGLRAMVSKLPTPANDRDGPANTRTSASKKRPLSVPDHVFLEALTHDWNTAGNLWRLLNKRGITIGEGTVYNRMRKLAADYPNEVEATDKPERWRLKATIPVPRGEQPETTKMARQQKRPVAKPRLRLVSSVPVSEVGGATA